jgi:hypothetical protein
MLVDIGVSLDILQGPLLGVPPKISMLLATLRPLMIFDDDFCRWSRTFTLVFCG